MSISLSASLKLLLFTFVYSFLLDLRLILALLLFLICFYSFLLDILFLPGPRSEAMPSDQLANTLEEKTKSKRENGAEAIKAIKAQGTRA